MALILHSRSSVTVDYREETKFSNSQRTLRFTVDSNVLDLIIKLMKLKHELVLPDGQHSLDLNLINAVQGEISEESAER